MAATITLTAVPGHIEQHAGYRAKTVEFCSRELARITMPARTVGEVREAVRAFGSAIRARQPDASFAILVGVRRGDRKPAGFDTAQRGNGFGQDDFLRVADRRAAPGEAAAAAIAEDAADRKAELGIGP